MTNSILWEYWEKLPELGKEVELGERHHRLAVCYPFYTSHSHKVEDKRGSFLDFTSSFEYVCPRQAVENSPSDITAVEQQKKNVSSQLKFIDILIYYIARNRINILPIAGLIAVKYFGL